MCIVQCIHSLQDVKPVKLEQVKAAELRVCVLSLCPIIVSYTLYIIKLKLYFIVYTVTILT